MINHIIGLLLPSIIGVHVCNQIYGDEANITKKIERYILLVLFTNLISYIFVVYVLKIAGFEFTNQFTIKYLLLSSFFAAILPIISSFWHDKLKLNVVVKKNEK